jgi:hypothetical protein
MRMLLQILTQRLAQNSHAAAVNDADARQAGQEGAVDELLDFSRGVVDGAPITLISEGMLWFRFPATPRFHAPAPL